MTTIGHLMKEDPRHWGLRGDPYLWRQLKAELKNKQLPRTRSELALILEQHFGHVTGHSLALEEEFFMPEHAHGGMSSGMISCDFWRRVAFPTILTRFDRIA
jgi:hypothetical protein